MEEEFFDELNDSIDRRTQPCACAMQSVAIYLMTIAPRYFDDDVDEKIKFFHDVADPRRDRSRSLTKESFPRPVDAKSRRNLIYRESTNIRGTI